MKMNECPHFNECSAPLCPLSKRSINYGCWLISEPICKNVAARKKYNWIVKQRKLNRKITDDSFSHGVFTAEMLERIKRVTKNTAGLPDIKKRSMYRTWLQDHPKTTKSMKQVARDIRLAQNGADALAAYRNTSKKP